MTDLVTIGKRVQEVRQARTDLSQEDVARELDVSWQTISRLERGKGKKLDLERLREVAEVLGVSVDDLLGTAA